MDIVNDPARVDPIRTVVRALAEDGRTAGMGLSIKNGQILFFHRWCGYGESNHFDIELRKLRIFAAPSRGILENARSDPSARNRLRRLMKKI